MFIEHREGTLPTSEETLAIGITSWRFLVVCLCLEVELYGCERYHRGNLNSNLIYLGW